MVKEGKKEAIRGCTNCGKPGKDNNPVKKCAVCGLTYYCSQECQKSTGPSTSPTARPNTATASKHSSNASPHDLALHPGLPLVLTFNLHRMHTLPPDKRTTVLRAALSVHIDVGIEPTMIGEFMNLYTYPEECVGATRTGWRACSCSTTSRGRTHRCVPPRPLSPKDITMWRQVREDADADGEWDNAVVLVRFVDNFKQMITCLFVVGDEEFG